MNLASDLNTNEGNDGHFGLGERGNILSNLTLKFCVRGCIKKVVQVQE